MVLPSEFQKIVENLYTIYKLRGFIREEEVMALTAASSLSLADTERLTDKLLGLGVIFADEETEAQGDDDDIDYTHTDYEVIFTEVLSVAPGMEMIINYIRGIRPPQRGEWRTLITQTNSGNKFARNRLIDMYLRVVVKFTLQTYANYDLAFEDLFQEGTMGLMRAIQKYDPTRHGSFVSYFPFWVMQFMNRANMHEGQLIRLPVHLYEIQAQYKSRVKKISENNGEEGTTTTVAKEMGIPVSKVKQISKYTYEFRPLEEFVSYQEDGYLECNLVATTSEPLINAVEKRLLQENISSLLDALPERESAVLRMRYGLDDGQERTLEEVGNELNVTRERIRQIEANALRKLRKPSNSRKLEYVPE